MAGTIAIPPSKSLSHRALICAGLSQGKSILGNILPSQDILATCKALESLGVKIDWEKEQNNKDIHPITVKGQSYPRAIHKEINCRESGSTLRFLIPLAALTGEKIRFIGQGKLGQRPLEPYYEIFQQQNIRYRTTQGGLPLTIQGKLQPGIYSLRGDISSQFITGLLFALPLLDGDSTIILTTPLESKGYIDLTLDTLEKFSLDIENQNHQKFIIKGNQQYKAKDYSIEGDFSQGAFWLVAGTLGGEIQSTHLNPQSLQGDRVIVDILRQMGGDISQRAQTILAKPSLTKGITIDAAHCPDLVPILAVLASLSQGNTRIINAQRLRIKESDRLKAISTELNKLGAQVEELPDGLIIQGRENLQGGEVDSWNDHRIAMALAIASIKCKEPVIMTNSEAVTKSYPYFWRDFEKLGGEIHECNMG